MQTHVNHERSAENTCLSRSIAKPTNAYRRLLMLDYQNNHRMTPKNSAATCTKPTAQGGGFVWLNNLLTVYEETIIQ